jgi:hypothetical protein
MAGGTWVAKCRCGMVRDAISEPEKLTREAAQTLDRWSAEGWNVERVDGPPPQAHPCACPPPPDGQLTLFGGRE